MNINGDNIYLVGYPRIPTPTHAYAYNLPLVSSRDWFQDPTLTPGIPKSEVLKSLTENGSCLCVTYACPPVCLESSLDGF